MEDASHRRIAAYRRLVALAALLAVCSLVASCGGKSQDGVSTAATKSRVKPDLVGQHLPPLTPFEQEPDGTLKATISAEFLFGLDNATVSSKAETRIRHELVPEILDRLRDQDAGLLIEGYTDGLGTAAHNLDLSRRRAVAVERILVDATIPAAQLTTQGLGEQGSVDDRADPSRRKVVLVISGASA
jgi:OOP family OmpA-OmpF porin